MDINYLQDRAAVQTDFSGLNKLREKAVQNDPQALRVAAEQFEGILLNMMLQSMRKANEAFSEDSIFNSKEVKFYQDMYDQQLSSTMSKTSHLGLADMIVKQLSVKTQKPDEVMPSVRDRSMSGSGLPLSSETDKRGFTIKSKEQVKGINISSQLNGNQ